MVKAGTRPNAFQPLPTPPGGSFLSMFREKFFSSGLARDCLCRPSTSSVIAELKYGTSSMAMPFELKSPPGEIANDSTTDYGRM